jgi:hypothetical protein
MLAMFRTTKASPGWKSKMWEGQTLESEQAKTINCMCTIIISHRILSEKINNKTSYGDHNF